MPAKPTVAEAKRNFAAAMDKLSVADAVREHPLERGRRARRAFRASHIAHNIPNT